ncbi:MAG: formyltransferase family protein [Candidatus Omnitrophota bacterium]
MRIIALVSNENTYQPLVYDELLRGIGSEVVGLVIVPMMPSFRSKIKFLRFLFDLYSVQGFLIKLTHVARNKVLALLDPFFPLKHSCSLKRVAKKHGVPLLYTDDVNSEEFLEQVRQLKPDLIISSQGQIIRKGLLQASRFGIINKHAGMLPKYRGIYPVFWAMMNDEKQIGITIHFMNEAIDGGDIILQEALDISKKDTFESVYQKVIHKTPGLFLKAINIIREGDYQLMKNDSKFASYYSYPTRNDIVRFKKLGKRIM